MNEPELTPCPRTARGKESAERLRGRVAIAKAIIEARLRKNWTQLQLAEAAGTKQSRISELESIRGNPTLESIERVAQALDLELSLNQVDAFVVQTHSLKRIAGASYVITPLDASSRIDMEAKRFERVPIPVAGTAGARAPARQRRFA